VLAYYLQAKLLSLTSAPKDIRDLDPVNQLWQLGYWLGPKATCNVAPEHVTARMLHTPPHLDQQFLKSYKAWRADAAAQPLSPLLPAKSSRGRPGMAKHSAAGHKRCVPGQQGAQRCPCSMRQATEYQALLEQNICPIMDEWLPGDAGPAAEDGGACERYMCMVGGWVLQAWVVCCWPTRPSCSTCTCFSVLGCACRVAVHTCSLAGLPAGHMPAQDQAPASQDVPAAHLRADGRPQHL
jgi:hypothetical protein